MSSILSLLEKVVTSTRDYKLDRSKEFRVTWLVRSHSRDVLASLLTSTYNMFLYDDYSVLDDPVQDLTQYLTTFQSNCAIQFYVPLGTLSQVERGSYKYDVNIVDSLNIEVTLISGLIEFV